MKNYRIYLFRHGATSGNADGLYIGRTDLPLSDEGREGLERLVNENIYPRVDRVYSSPLSRAIGTAEILFPDINTNEIMVVDDLREMDFGAFEGVKAEELANLDSFKAWLHGGIDAAPPGGETGREVLTRCFSGMDAIISDMMKSNITDAAVITHAGIIANILAAFGVPKIRPETIKTDFGEGYMINVSAQLWHSAHTFEIAGALPVRR
jgi:alpha-ribazole phosphatase